MLSKIKLRCSTEETNYRVEENPLKETQKRKVTPAMQFNIFFVILRGRESLKPFSQEA